MTTSKRSVELLLDNGKTRKVPAALALDGTLAGVDGGGHLVATSHGMTYPLTDCCAASGKGAGDVDATATGIVCRSCYTDVDPYFGGPATIAAAFLPLTDAQRHAVKQGWKLSDGKMDELRARLAAVEVPTTPTADFLADPMHGNMPRAAAEKEAARLKRNAVTQAWRERTRLQASIDTRAAKYALLRAAKTKPAAAPDPTEAPDAADQAEQTDSAADLGADLGA